MNFIIYSIVLSTLLWGYLKADEDLSICPKFGVPMGEPDSSEFKKVEVHGLSYYVSQGKKSHTDAIVTCKKYGLNLVSVLDKSKNEDLVTAIENGGGKPNKGYFYWTSGTRQPDDCWAWWDLIPAFYTNWKKGEPNNTRKQENCIFLYFDGQWNDASCQKEQYYICELVTADMLIPKVPDADVTVGSPTQSA